MNSDRSISLSLKYKTFSASGSEDVGVLLFEFVAKTQFLCKILEKYSADQKAVEYEDEI